MGTVRQTPFNFAWSQISARYHRLRQGDIVRRRIRPSYTLVRTLSLAIFDYDLNVRAKFCQGRNRRLRTGLRQRYTCENSQQIKAGTREGARPGQGLPEVYSTSHRSLAFRHSLPCKLTCPPG